MDTLSAASTLTSIANRLMLLHDRRTLHGDPRGGLTLAARTQRSFQGRHLALGRTAGDLAAPVDSSMILGVQALAATPGTGGGKSSAVFMLDVWCLFKILF